ncbi:sigma factor-like helix-turn-helix DNA-binding protein [Streptomyces sp. CA2R106]|uniref:sigma factor-like helix-turn-helix DNA-binding protein n=1 Tax=Streptomyces sp. CA2R106 TaxID=3120153 RepID=UPI00300AE32E
MTSRRKARKQAAAQKRNGIQGTTAVGGGDSAAGRGGSAAGRGGSAAGRGGSAAGRGGAAAGRGSARRTHRKGAAGGSDRPARPANGATRPRAGAETAARPPLEALVLVAATAPTAIGAPTATAAPAPEAAPAPVTLAPATRGLGTGGPDIVAPAPVPDAPSEPHPAEPAAYPLGGTDPDDDPPDIFSLAPHPPAPAATCDLGLSGDASPADAFDALYRHAAGALARQAELLTGDPDQARKSVAYAYELAWQRWPEVARDSDPVGWLRAAVYEHALAPWQRWVPEWAGGHRPQPCTPDDALAAALLALPPRQRTAVLLHDGLGLALPAAAAEAEASETAAAARIVAARAALTEAVPDLAEEVLPERLGALLDERPRTETTSDDRTGADGAPGVASPEPPVPAGRPAGVRAASERATRHRTVGAYALTAVIAAVTTVAVIVTPDHQAPRPAGRSGPTATATAPAPSTDLATTAPGAVQHSGAGPLPSGERTRAATGR